MTKQTNRLLLVGVKAWIFIGMLSFSAAALAEAADESQSVAWWIEQALESFREIDDKSTLSEASSAIVYPLIRNGRLNDAEHAAKHVLNLQKRVYAQVAVAKQYLSQGDEAKYLALMHELELLVLQSDKKSPSNFLTSHLLRQYTESKHVAEAVAFAAQLPGGFQQSGAYQEIANGLAQRGALQAAYQLMDEHAPKKWSQGAAVGIAYEVARTGRIAETETAIMRLKEVKHRDATYRNLAKALAKVELPAEGVTADQMELAKQNAEKIIDPVVRSQTLAGIVAKQVRTEQDEIVLESMLAAADTREQKQAVLQRLCEVFVQQKKVTEAEETILRMLKAIETAPREAAKSKFGIYGDTSEVARAKLLYASTAILLAEQGDPQASRQRLKWATLAYEEIPEAAFLVKVQTLPTLVRAYLQAGDQVGARQVVTKRVPQAKSAFQKSILATLLIEAGDFESARQLAGPLGADPTGADPTVGHALGRVASAFVQAGQFADGQQLLKTLDPTGSGQEAYRVVARGMVDGGQIAELKQWLPKMPSPAARVQACLGAINGLSQ